MAPSRVLLVLVLMAACIPSLHGTPISKHWGSAAEGLMASKLQEAARSLARDKVYRPMFTPKELEVRRGQAAGLQSSLLLETSAMRKTGPVTGHADARMRSLMAQVERRPDDYVNATVKHYDNGMTLIHRYDPSAPLVSVVFGYRAGSRHETYENQGVAHLLEHMLFKGTQTRPLQWGRLYYAIGSLTNAFTVADMTAYTHTVHRTGLTALLELEADRMKNCTLPEAELEREKKVVMSELTSGRGSLVSLLDEAVKEAAYGDTWAGRSVGGKTVMDLTRSQAESFYLRGYRPGCLTIVVVGDVEIEDLVDQIDHTHLPRVGIDQKTYDLRDAKCDELPVVKPEHVAERPDFDPSKDAHKVVMRRKGADAAVVEYVLPTVPLGDVDTVAALGVLQRILNGGGLERALAEGGGISGASAVVVGQHHADAGWLTVLASAPTPDEDTVVSLDNALSGRGGVFERLALHDEEKNGIVTQAAVRAAIRQVVEETRGEWFQDVSSMAQSLAVDAVVTGDHMHTQRVLNSTKRVEVADVVAVAARFLRKEKVAVGALVATGSDAEERATVDRYGDVAKASDHPGSNHSAAYYAGLTCQVPDAAEVLELVAKIPYRPTIEEQKLLEGSAAPSGEDDPHGAGKSLAATPPLCFHNACDPPHAWSPRRPLYMKLENGMEIIAHDTDSVDMADRVAMFGFLDAGMHHDPVGYEGTAMMTSMVMQLNVEAHMAAEAGGALGDGGDSSGSIIIAPQVDGMLIHGKIRCDRASSALRAIQHAVTNSLMPTASENAAMQGIASDAAEAMAADPAFIMRQVMLEGIYPEGHPLRRNPTRESVRRIPADLVKKFYIHRVCPEHLKLAVVAGKYAKDPVSLMHETAALFEKWPRCDGAIDRNNATSPQRRLYEQLRPPGAAPTRVVARPEIILPGGEGGIAGQDYERGDARGNNGSAVSLLEVAEKEGWFEGWTGGIGGLGRGFGGEGLIGQRDSDVPPKLNLEVSKTGWAERLTEALAASSDGAGSDRSSSQGKKSETAELLRTTGNIFLDWAMGKTLDSDDVTASLSSFGKQPYRAQVKKSLSSDEVVATLSQAFKAASGSLGPAGARKLDASLGGFGLVEAIADTRARFVEATSVAQQSANDVMTRDAPLAPPPSGRLSRAVGQANLAGGGHVRSGGASRLAALLRDASSFTEWGGVRPGGEKIDELGVGLGWGSNSASSGAPRMLSVDDLGPRMAFSIVELAKSLRPEGAGARRAKAASDGFTKSVGGMVDRVFAGVSAHVASAGESFSLSGRTESAGHEDRSDVGVEDVGVHETLNDKFAELRASIDEFSALHPEARAVLKSIPNVLADGRPSLADVNARLGREIGVLQEFVDKHPLSTDNHDQRSSEVQGLAGNLAVLQPMVNELTRTGEQAAADVLLGPRVLRAQQATEEDAMVAAAQVGYDESMGAVQGTNQDPEPTTAGMFGTVELPSIPDEVDYPDPIPRPDGPLWVRRNVPGLHEAVTIVMADTVAHRDHLFVPAIVANHIIGANALSGRLGSIVRDCKGLSYHIASDIEASQRAGLLTVTMQTQGGPALAQAVNDTLGILADAREGSFTEADLRAAQRNLLSLSHIEAADGVALAQNLLFDLVHAGRFDHNLWSARTAGIAKLTLKDLREGAASAFRPNRVVILSVGEDVEDITDQGDDVGGNRTAVRPVGTIQAPKDGNNDLLVTAGLVLDLSAKDYGQRYTGDDLKGESSTSDSFGPGHGAMEARFDLFEEGKLAPAVRRQAPDNNTWPARVGAGPRLHVGVRYDETEAAFVFPGGKGGVVLSLEMATNPLSAPSVTFEAWVKVVGYFPESTATVLAQLPEYEGVGGDGTPGSRALILSDTFGRSPASHPSATVTVGEGWDSGLDSPPAGEWAHVVGTWEQGGSSTVYINGISGNTFSPTANAAGFDPQERFVIGGSDDPGIVNTPMLVSDVRVYSRKLTQSEVTRLFAVGRRSDVGCEQPSVPDPSNPFSRGQYGIEARQKRLTPQRFSPKSLTRRGG